MKKIFLFTLPIIVLVSCVSSTDMDQQFYGGIKQGSQEFGEAIGDFALYIGMYEGSNDLLHSTEWQASTLASSEVLVGKARALFSIVDTYCPRSEKILCGDVEDLYEKVRALHGTLEAAVKGNSNSQMNAAIQKFDEILAHLEAMDNR